MSDPTQFTLFRRSNGFWYVVFTEDNYRVWRSTKCHLKRDALEALTTFKQVYRPNMGVFLRGRGARHFVFEPFSAFRVGRSDALSFIAIPYESVYIQTNGLHFDPVGW